jgi:hypothetical protein
MMTTTSTAHINTRAFMENTRNYLFKTSTSTQNYIIERNPFKRAKKSIPPVVLVTVDKIVCAQLDTIKVEHSMKLKQLLEINKYICSNFGISIYNKDYIEYIKVTKKFYCNKAKQSKKIKKKTKSPLSTVYTVEI